MDQWESPHEQWIHPTFLLSLLLGQRMFQWHNGSMLTVSEWYRSWTIPKDIPTASRWQLFYKKQSWRRQHWTLWILVFRPNLTHHKALLSRFLPLWGSHSDAVCLGYCLLRSLIFHRATKTADANQLVFYWDLIVAFRRQLTPSRHRSRFWYW